MRGMTTLGQVRHEAEIMAANHYDQMIPVPELSFDDLRHLSIAGQRHHLNSLAQRSMAARLGIPHNYLAKCPPDLQAEQLRYWLKRLPNKQLFVRFDGRRVRAIFTARYKPVNNVEVLNTLLEMGYGHDTKVQVRMDGEFMSLSIPDHDGTFAVHGGDHITPGVSVSNSEVGLSSLSISAFFLRLVCTNGLITKEQMSASYRHVSHGLLERMSEALRGKGASVAQQRQRFQMALSSEVADPRATIDAFNKQFGLSEAEQEAAHWGFAHEPGETMFQVVNAYTKGAQYPALPAVSSHRLEQVGGEVLGMVA